LIADVGNFRVRRIHNTVLNTLAGTTIQTIFRRRMHSELARRPGAGRQGRSVYRQIGVIVWSARRRATAALLRISRALNSRFRHWPTVFSYRHDDRCARGGCISPTHIMIA
jgi:hypothetical protein